MLDRIQIKYFLFNRDGSPYGLHDACWCLYDVSQYQLHCAANKKHFLAEKRQSPDNIPMKPFLGHVIMISKWKLSSINNSSQKTEFNLFKIVFDHVILRKSWLTAIIMYLYICVGSVMKGGNAITTFSTYSLRSPIHPNVVVNFCNIYCPPQLSS